MKRIFTLLTFSLILGSTSPGIAADAGPVTHDLFKHDDIQIEVLSQGKGPTIVMLPSLGRSGEDYQATSEVLALQGFLVIRPQPRGIGRSEGPMDGLEMHALAGDVAFAIHQEKAGSRGRRRTCLRISSAANWRPIAPTSSRASCSPRLRAGKVPPGSQENRSARRCAKRSTDRRICLYPKSNVLRT